MGLFDKVLNKGPETLTPAEGFVGIAVCAIAADGVITQDEVQGLATSLGRMRLFQGANPRQVQGSFEKVVRVAKDQGVEALMKQCAGVIPQDKRATAFAIAADLVFADGDVAASEKKYLESMAHHLGVKDDLALKIVEVLAIKNAA